MLEEAIIWALDDKINQKYFNDDYFLKDNWGLIKCGTGLTSVGISPEGKIFACQEHSTYQNDDDIFLIGDVFSGIDEKRHIRFLEQYSLDMRAAVKRYKNSQKCKSCLSLRQCLMGSCSSESHYISGEMFKFNDFWCWWKNLGRTIGYLFIARANMEKNKNIFEWIDSLVEGRLEDGMLYNLK